MTEPIPPNPPVVPEENKARRTVGIAVMTVLLVALGYAAVLMVGGNALQDAPFAKQIIGARERLREITIFQPPKVLPPPLQSSDITVSTTPSPVIAELSPTPSPSLSPSFVPPPANSPSIVTFSISYENTTGVRLTGVQIADKIPSGGDYRTGSASPAATFDGSQLVWSIGDLAPGASGTVMFQILTSRKGKITNRAVMTSNEAPPADIESSTTV